MTPRQYTPGPWEPGCFVNPDSKCKCSYIFGGGYAGSVAQVSVDNECFIQHGGNDSPKLVEARANAHLIAAAPELLEALKEACDLIKDLVFYANSNGGEYPFREFDEGRAAIAKALPAPPTMAGEG